MSVRHDAHPEARVREMSHGRIGICVDVEALTAPPVGSGLPHGEVDPASLDGGYGRSDSGAFAPSEGTER